MGIDPSIINRIRAESSVGPDSIEHVHHITIPRQAEAPAEEMIEDPRSLPDTEKKTPRLALLFRSAWRGARGEEDGSAET